jgi:hypothetical protein
MKTDPVTMACREHDVRACMLCMIDALNAWLGDLHARRQRIKAERRAMAVEERYDLGGEG